MPLGYPTYRKAKAVGGNEKGERENKALLLGYQAHLKAKAGGESSMSGKPECHEAAKRQVRQGPDGMVKAELPEPQCPNCNHAGRKRWLSSGRFPQNGLSVPCRPLALQGSWTVCNGLNKDTNRAPKPS